MPVANVLLKKFAMKSMILDQMAMLDSCRSSRHTPYTLPLLVASGKNGNARKKGGVERSIPEKVCKTPRIYTIQKLYTRYAKLYIEYTKFGKSVIRNIWRILNTLSLL
jgi:hypothetical protein